MPDVWASRLSMIPGEAHRDRIIHVQEGKACLGGAQAPFLLRDAAVILLDCGIRPEECFRLRWENGQNGVIEITHGKTDNARHRIPLSQSAQSVLEMRRGTTEGPWIFPAPTKSGHIEPSSLRGQHAKACTLPKVEHYPIYTFRHTCLTRWAPAYK